MRPSQQRETLNTDWHPFANTHREAVKEEEEVNCEVPHSIQRLLNIKEDLSVKMRMRMNLIQGLLRFQFNQLKAQMRE